MTRGRIDTTSGGPFSYGCCPASLYVGILETRIAPAAFYVSGTSLEIQNAAGVAQKRDTEAAMAVGADHALLLHAGDRLIFNPDGDVRTHLTDARWVTVTASDALVLLKDLNGDQRYSLDELTGLAVGNRFSGTVFSDIHGSVATMLDRTGHFSPLALPGGSISRLTVTGALVADAEGYANILAGRGISNLTVLGQDASGLSLNGVVATGDQTTIPTGFGGPLIALEPGLFEHVPGAGGGNVVNAHFSGGLHGILTGRGQYATDGLGNNGGAGGSIVNVTMGISPAGFQLETGDGGNASGIGRGSGGAGGNIIGFHGSFHSTVANYPDFFTGAGGTGSGPGAGGGAGGSIVNSSFRDLDAAAAFKLETGKGGDGFKFASGGAGGSIVNTGVTLLGDLGTTIDVNGTMQRSGGELEVVLGAGGNASGTFPAPNISTAGAGGSWWWSSTKAAITTQGLASFHLTAGDSGSTDVGRGAAAGSVVGGHFDFHGSLGILGDGDFKISGGESGPSYIGDFHSVFGLGTTNLGLDGMGGLVAGQGGSRYAVFSGRAGSVSNVTADRIAAIFAGAMAMDATSAVASITGVRAAVIRAVTGLPGTAKAPALRGYGTYTYNAATPQSFEMPVDGPVIVRKSGYHARSLSVTPLYLILVPDKVTFNTSAATGRLASSCTRSRRGCARRDMGKKPIGRGHGGR